MRYVVTTVAVALSAVTLTGCGSGGGRPPAPLAATVPPSARADPGGPPAGVTGCSPLEAPSVARTLTTPPLQALEDSSGRVCRYVLADGTVVLVVRAGDLPRAVLGGPAQVAAASAAGAGMPQPVGGVGDAAYFYVTEQGAHALTLAAGSGETVTSVTLTASGPALLAPRERLADLGRQVLRALDRARGR